VDIGGLGLPNTVFTINQVIESRKKASGAGGDENARLKAFLCCALNDKQMFDFMNSILVEDDILLKHYESIANGGSTTAYILRKPLREKMLGFLGKLDKLPFSLAIDNLM
jgi:RUN domain